MLDLPDLEDYVRGSSGACAAAAAADNPRWDCEARWRVHPSADGPLLTLSWLIYFEYMTTAELMRELWPVTDLTDLILQVTAKLNGLTVA
jgi:hypothetical protein